PRLRRGGSLGGGQVRVQGQGVLHHPYRSAVLGVAGDFGHDLRAAVRRQQRALAVAEDAKPADSVRRAGNRAGDDLRHLPVRGARTDPADAGPGLGRRGSGDLARRQWLAGVLVRDAAQYPLGPALWRLALQCPRHGRVRRRVGDLGPHPGRDQHHAAANRDFVQPVQFRRRLRHGIAAGAAGPRHPRLQDRPRTQVRGCRLAPPLGSTRLDIRVQNIRKEFSRYPALHDVSLDIVSGELIALLGPSGSGKTTLLRLIAGLETPTEGRILFGDEDASRKSVQERHVGFVFQHYALFRHMTILENVSFGLRVRDRARRPPRAAIRQRALELIELVQLKGLEKRYPNQLS